MPKSTLGKGKRTQVFQDFWRGLYLVWREERVTVLLQGEILDHWWNIPALFAYRWEKKLAWKMFYSTSFPARRLIQLVWLILCKYRRVCWHYFLWLECNTIHHGVGKILCPFLEPKTKATASASVLSDRTDHGTYSLGIIFFINLFNKAILRASPWWTDSS